MTSSKKISIAEARNRLSVLVNDVAHGHDRVVLTSRGRPKAAIVGLDDLAALEDLPHAVARDVALLQEIDALHERIFDRRGAVVSDSVEDLAVIRAGQERSV
jgi:prevent-host-death family protein